MVYASWHSSLVCYGSSLWPAGEPPRLSSAGPPLLPVRQRPISHDNKHGPRCNKKDWASNYLPIEEQLHPFRDPVSLAPGSATLRSTSSINVGCVYTVQRDCLRELNFRNPSSGAPTLSEAAMETVLHYVANKFHDHDAPWKPHAKQYRPEAAVSAPPVSVAAPVVAAPIVGLIAAPVAAVVSYASVASQAPIVTVEASVSPQVNEAVGAKRKLSPGAKVFRPSKQRVHLVSSATA